MGRRKSFVDDDGEDISVSEQRTEVVEAFLNDDLITDFVQTYSPGNRYNWTHIFTRAQLRNMFGATLDMNTLDPLNGYILALRPHGFTEQVSPSGEPCLYVVEKEIPFAEEVDYESE